MRYSSKTCRQTTKTIAMTFSFPIWSIFSQTTWWIATRCTRPLSSPNAKTILRNWRMQYKSQLSTNLHCNIIWVSCSKKILLLLWRNLMQILKIIVCCVIKRLKLFVYIVVAHCAIDAIQRIMLKSIQNNVREMVFGISSLKMLYSSPKMRKAVITLVGLISQMIMKMTAKG